MTQNELNKIIENHQHYLNKDIDGWKSMRADLSYKNLSGLDLKNANLYRVDLKNANLREVDLRNADLREADLRNANLYGANLNNADLSSADLNKAVLREADLRESNLSNADLRKANLRDADLIDADLRDADLRDADLSNADLRESNLSNTDLRKADLRKADLSNADLGEANIDGADLKEANLLGTNLKNTDIVCAVISEDTKIDYPIACPETGSFIGYKKAVSEKIVKLQICKDAKRSSATAKKCRCSKALVLSIENMDGSDSGLQEVESHFDPCFIYRVGEIAEVYNFDNDRWRECASGIHFFMDRQDAVEYGFLFF
mgnify:CR=1 FL=1